jgi:hypothetical protein
MENDFFEMCFNKVRSRIDYDFIKAATRNHFKICDSIVHEASPVHTREVELYREYFLKMQIRMNAIFAGLLYYQKQGIYPSAGEMKATIHNDSIQVADEVYEELTLEQKEQYPVNIYFSDAQEFDFTNPYSLQRECESLWVWIACMGELCEELNSNKIQKKIEDGTIKNFDSYIVKMGLSLAEHGIKMANKEFAQRFAASYTVKAA